MQLVLKNTPLLKGVRDLATKEFPLKLGVAIDESSTCKTLVRSIIDNQHISTIAVAAGLELDTEALQVRFAIGGTGAATGTIGSNTANFSAVYPSATTMTADLCNLFLGDDVCLILPGETEPRKVTYEKIIDKLPVLATLMMNGRMSSIAARELRGWDKSYAVVEAELFSRTVASYIASSGMKSLAVKPELRLLVAACAFAVHLFPVDEG
jgi:hypothetical protein